MQAPASSSELENPSDDDDLADAMAVVDQASERRQKLDKSIDEKAELKKRNVARKGPHGWTRASRTRRTRSSTRLNGPSRASFLRTGSSWPTRRSAAPRRPSPG